MGKTTDKKTLNSQVEIDLVQKNNEPKTGEKYAKRLFTMFCNDEFRYNNGSVDFTDENGDEKAISWNPSNEEKNHEPFAEKQNEEDSLKRDVIQHENQSYFYEKKLDNNGNDSRTMISPLYDKHGNRTDKNLIPYYGVADISVIGISKDIPSTGWKNIFEWIETAQENDELQIVFFASCYSTVCILEKVENGFLKTYTQKATNRRSKLTGPKKSITEENIADGEFFENATQLKESLVPVYESNTARHSKSGSLPRSVIGYVKDMPNIYISKDYIQRMSPENYQKKMFARDMGNKAREHNIPFDFLMKMNGNVEATKLLIASLDNIKSIDEKDTHGFYLPAYGVETFDKYKINYNKKSVEGISNLNKEELEKFTISEIQEIRKKIREELDKQIEKGMSVNIDFSSTYISPWGNSDYINDIMRYINMTNEEDAKQAKLLMKLISGYLEEKNLLSKSLDTLAIKNSKGESSILSKSSFFKTKNNDFLISRALGHTSRRHHQGGNSWSLFNIEGIKKLGEENEMDGQDKAPNKKMVDFGTYDGSECNLGIYEEDLIPINIQEREDLSGHKFRYKKDFSWFNGGIDRKRDRREGREYYSNSKNDNLLCSENERFNLVNNNGNFEVHQTVNDEGYTMPIAYEKMTQNGVELIVAQSIESDYVVDQRSIVFAYIVPNGFCKAQWMGYEIDAETMKNKNFSQAIENMQIKVANDLEYQINETLGRERGYYGNSLSQNEIMYFNKLGKFEACPKDSGAVGNCAVGTWDWMKKNIPNMPEFEGKITWNNFPIPIEKPIRMPLKEVFELAKKDSRFRAVVKHLYKKENPSGVLNNDDVKNILFSDPDSVLEKKIITAQEAKVLGLYDQGATEKYNNLTPIIESYQKIYDILNSDDAQEINENSLGNLYEDDFDNVKQKFIGKDDTKKFSKIIFEKINYQMNIARSRINNNFDNIENAKTNYKIANSTLKEVEDSIETDLLGIQLSDILPMLSDGLMSNLVKYSESHDSLCSFQFDNEHFLGNTSRTGYAFSGNVSEEREKQGRIFIDHNGYNGKNNQLLIIKNQLDPAQSTIITKKFIRSIKTEDVKRLVENLIEEIREGKKPQHIASEAIKNTQSTNTLGDFSDNTLEELKKRLEDSGD